MQVSRPPLFVKRIGKEPRQGTAIPGDGLRFEGVTFTYPGAETPAVRNVESAHCPRASGWRWSATMAAAKTTLVKLLTGLYDPARGT